MTVEARHAPDEYKGWADKSAALASYAKQAEDDELEKFALRVRARAIRRCGELLQQVEKAQNQHDTERRARVGVHISRTHAAEDAGLSEHKKNTALQVASIPEHEWR